MSTKVSKIIDVLSDISQRRILSEIRESEAENLFFSLFRAFGIDNYHNIIQVEKLMIFNNFRNQNDSLDMS